ncbi:MAG: hypothetical protein ACRD5B_04965, partial [Nitrososphaeraceae archaeon]
IRGHLRSLEKKQLLIRRYRQGTSNEYDFGPLITKLEAYAQALPNRIKNQKPPYSNLASPPYSETNTKEDAVIENTKRKIRSYASRGKPTAIGEILGSRYRGQ